MRAPCFLAALLIVAAAITCSRADQSPPQDPVFDTGNIHFGAIKCTAGTTCDVSTVGVKSAPETGAPELGTSLSDLPIRPEQFKKFNVTNPDPDDTLSFIAAARTGRILQLEAGATYTLCSAIGIKRGVIGWGATIKPCANFPYSTETITLVTTGQKQSGTAKQPYNSIFYNANWSATVVTDDGLIFRGFTIDTRGTSVENDSQFHAIKVRMARNVTVDGVTVYGGGDCTAFQASDVTLIRASRCYGVRNAGFDHWEGPTNALVENNIVTCGPRINGNGADGGVMFTGSSTTLADRKGANLTSRNNKISGGCNAGLFVNNLSPGSSLTNVVSEGDTIDASGNAAMIGIVFEGNMKGGRISDALLKNGNGPAALLLRPDIISIPSGSTTSGKPARVNVATVTVLDWTTTASNLSPVTLYGYGHSVTRMILSGGANNTSTSTENDSISVSGAFNPKTSTYGVYNCLSGCTVRGAVTVGHTTTVH